MLYNYRFTFSFLIAIPATLFLYLFEETKNRPEIIVYNKTGYQLDSLEFEEHYFQLQPNDSINKNIESIIRDVIAKKRERPTFEDAVR